MEASRSISTGQVTKGKQYNGNREDEGKNLWSSVSESVWYNRFSQYFGGPCDRLGEG